MEVGVEGWDTAEAPIEAKITLQEVRLCHKEMVKDRPVDLPAELGGWEATVQERDPAAIVSAPVAAKNYRTSRGYPVLIRPVLNAAPKWSGG